MPVRSTTGALAALALAVSPALAADVLVLSSGDADLDGTAVALLETAGHEVTLGHQIWELTGTEDLSAHDSVLALCGPNWSSILSLFSEPAQWMLADYAEAGGGIVFSEWIGYSTRFQTVLAGILPTDYVSYISEATVEFVRSGSAEAERSTVTCQMPAAISVASDNYEGTESWLTAKPGATVFFESATTGGAGVAGWSVGSGRVLQFSSSIGLNQLTDFTFSRLVLNAVDWAGEEEACRADLVRDGLLDLSDVTAFIDAFTGGCE
jgi:hypothetical protein